MEGSLNAARSHIIAGTYLKGRMNTMKHTQRFFRFGLIMLLLCLMLLGTAGAESDASAGLDNAEFDEAADVPQDTLPDFDFFSQTCESETTDTDSLPELFEEEEETRLPLPKPGTYFKYIQTAPVQSGVVYKNRVYDVYLFRQQLEWSAELNGYLLEAQSRGYTLSAQRIDGYNAYILTGEGRQAMLFLNYKGSQQFMFMLEKGFEMEEANIVTKELESGDMFVTINGALYTYSGLSMRPGSVTDTYWGTSRYQTNWDGSAVWGIQNISTEVLNMGFTDADGRGFQLSVPANCKTGSEYHKVDRNVRLKLFGINYMNGTTVAYNPQRDWKNPKNNAYTRWINELKTEKDGFDLYILYRSETEIRGELEGVFGDGETVIKVEFWLPVK